MDVSGEPIMIYTGQATSGGPDSIQSLTKEQSLLGNVSGSRVIDGDFVTKIVAQHGLWKYRLLTAIETGASAYTPEMIAKEDICVLGKWLFGEARSQLSPDVFDDVRQRHSNLHKIAS